MPQYLLSVHHGDDVALPDGVAVDDLYRDVDAFNTAQMDAGRWVFGGGLLPADSATVVDARGGTAKITNGPYTRSEEYMGGFWVLRAADLAEALQLAEQASTACRGPVEVRPFQDASAV